MPSPEKEEVIAFFGGKVSPQHATCPLAFRHHTTMDASPLQKLFRAVSGSRSPVPFR